MKITNDRGLNELMAEVLAAGERKVLGEAKYSVTQLIKPPRILQLERRHADDITVDVLGIWNTFMGHAAHAEIYKALNNNDKYIVEQQIVQEINGVMVSGTPDLVDKENGILFDHKTKKTINFGYAIDPEYEAQLNIYAYLLNKTGVKISQLKLHVLYLDWRLAVLQKSIKGTYPPAPSMLFEVPFWTESKVEKYLAERIALHEAAEKLEDEKLPECTSEEVWEKEGKFAIMPNVKNPLKAIKLCRTMQEVQDYIVWKGLRKGSYVVEHRNPQRTRCQSYCSAAPFCNQYQAWLKSQEEVNEADESAV